jgi:nicotinate-nucleotide pyrophosphorylase (carboxylating)
MVLIDYLLHFIEEDAPFGDVTSAAIIPDITCSAVIRAEQPGVIAGIKEVSLIFSHFGVSVKPLVQDGEMVGRGDTLLLLNGNAKGILLVERTALNIIGRMSGIATKTKKITDVVSAINPSCRVAAVKIGGGDPHRMNLSDGILIKDNHLVLVPLITAIRAAKKVSVYTKIEVEVETSDDALSASKAGADIIMLDNMSPEKIAQTIDILKHEGLRDRVIIEISGGITEGKLEKYAELDIDVISLGALTHSVRNLSVNLEILPRNVK